MLLDSDAALTFVTVEVGTCELFADLALDADEGSRRTSLTLAARSAYDTAAYFLPVAAFRQTARETLRQRLAQAGQKLRLLGETQIDAP